ncbi:tyrosine-type recombinase/integrase, partial [Clostridioides difficile]
FNFSRGEFKIYRKRGKEVLMPINHTCEHVIKDYLQNERTRDEPRDISNFETASLLLFIC